MLILLKTDETLFFSPIITAVIKSGTPLKILTLSKGDNYGKGATREEEMKNACGVFENWAVNRKPGLPTDVPLEHIRCEVLDVVKDDPRAQWDEKIILQEVREHIKKLKIEAVSSCQPPKPIRLGFKVKLIAFLDCDIR